MPKFVRRLPHGWPLLGLISALLLAGAGLAYGLAGGDTAGLRAVIRLTARTSLVLFLAAFAASALLRLAPAAPTRWLRRNRRQLGLGFAVSHLIHLAAIVQLAGRDPALFWQLTTPGNIISGGLAYLVIAAMAATSFDRSAAWLGPRAWRALHWAGSHFLAISFVVTNAKRIPASAWYGLPVALVALALALRLVAAMWRRGSAAPPLELQREL
ncbi:Sulfoxide reductase heme-binding subunit YedZ [bacterium YEK0313]|nr:Sulfoxide reductase heme-binding subunit YedZ [bacterium YEK0313]